MEIRRAEIEDRPALEAIMNAAISELQKGFLSAEEIAASFDIMGMDTQLIDDGTYYKVIGDGKPIGCGGWSRRATLYGGSHSDGRDARLLDPATEPARIRAMYTDPSHARRGVARLILSTCEAAARSEGFRRATLVSTLAGEPLYRAAGYQVVEENMAPTRKAISIPVRTMTKDL